MPEPKRPNKNDEDFYESMPATADRFFQPDATDEPEGRMEEPSIDQIRTTAIVTIVLVVLVAIGLGLIILRALDLMRSVTPT